MAFAATITITVDGNAIVLNRINQDNYGSEYSLLTSVDSWNLKIRHSKDSVDSDGITMLRHNLYLEHVVYPTPTTSIYKESVTWTIRQAQNSSPITIEKTGTGVATYLTANSSQVIKDLSIGLN